MRAEDSIQLVLDFMGDTLPTRKHALNYMFLVVGNGFRWENGELTNPHSDVYNRYIPVGNVQHAKGRTEDQWYDAHATFKKLIEKGAFTNTMDDFRYNFRWCLKEDNLPYSNCLLMTYPKDIKPDWLKVINEIKDSLKEEGIYV